MEKLVGESQYVVAWLLFWSCSLVAGLLAGGAAGLVIGAVLTLRGVDLPVIQIVSGVAGFLLGIPISYLFFRLFVGICIVRKVRERFSRLSTVHQKNPCSDSTIFEGRNPCT